VDGCERQQVNKARGLCALHYKQVLDRDRWTDVGAPCAPLGCVGGHYGQRCGGRELTPIAARRVPGTGSINRLGYKEITVAPLRGRDLKSTEHVHHRNGDRLDNRPSNLELWTTGQPNGQRVGDLLAWLAADYPTLFLAHAVGALTCHEAQTAALTGV
jgi:hypothetical protein